MDLFRPREIGDAHRLLGVAFGEREEGIDGVLAFFESMSGSELDTLEL